MGIYLFIHDQLLHICHNGILWLGIFFISIWVINLCKFDPLNVTAS